MKHLGVIFLAIVLLAFNACEKKVDTQADVETIKKLIEKSDMAWNSGDADALSDLYTDDAVQMPANEPSRMGKETIISRAKEGFEKVNNALKTSIEDIHITGDWAFLRATFVEPITQKRVVKRPPIMVHGFLF